MLDGGEQEKHGREECCEFPHSQQPSLSLEQSEHNNNGDSAHRYKLSQRSPCGLNLLCFKRQILEKLIYCAKALTLIFIAVINLYNALTVVSFLNRPDQLAKTFLLSRSQAFDVLGDPPQNEVKKRTCHESDNRQQPVVPDQHGKETDNLYAVTDDRCHH